MISEPIISRVAESDSLHWNGGAPDARVKPFIGVIAIHVPGIFVFSHAAVTLIPAVARLPDILYLLIILTHHYESISLYFK
jgi:hypothetical protein